ncbi:MAG: hypothetical protein JSV16_09040 [Candidatus Hydrogenedentota bacterium]|nr:MAG: hypothetical protein JSV16_09040 [Candidatus Hydrogenedentota bacterium]
MNVEQLTRYHPDVVEAIISYLGWDESKGHQKEPFLRRLRTMTALEAFHYFCEWHGLHDWAPLLADALDGLRLAQNDNDKGESE